MNRSEVIKITATKTGVPTDSVEEVVTTFFDICSEALAEGDQVNVRRFGKFEPRLRRAMVKPNPKSGEAMHIPERLSVTFLPSEILRARMNGELEES